MIIRFLKIIVIPILEVILGVWLANTFNFFEIISFIPKEMTFDICLMAYLAVINLLIDCVLNKINENLMSILTVTFINHSSETNLNTVPIIYLNEIGSDSEISEIKMQLQIIGRKKHFKKAQLVLPKIDFATMQVVTNQRIRLDENGNCVIDIEELFGESNNRISLSAQYTIPIIRDPVETRSVTITPEFQIRPVLKKLFVNYNYNKIKITTER